MKKTLFFLLFFLPGLGIHAQLVPVQNADSILKELGVKSISTLYQDETEEHVIFKKEFDATSKLVKKYQLYLWDAVSYSHTISYRYNDNSLLAEETKIQEILELLDRDNEYIKAFGDTPLNEKIYYYYNDDGLLTKKALFTFSTEEPQSNATPEQTINFEYENGLLLSEESESSDEKFFNKKYIVKYDYDSAGNLIQKSMAYGNDKELQRNTILKYDGKNQLVEEQIVDISIPHNNIHLQYEYNDLGQLSKKFVFDETENEFELETSFEYDEHGNTVAGDRNVVFEYYENGLIKSETWTDPITDVLMIFNTTYEYF